MTRISIIWTISFFLTTFSLLGQENSVDQSVRTKFSSRDLSKIQSLKDLSRNIGELTSDKKEQLQLLLLWSHENMYADSIRFFQNGYPLTTSEAFRRRIALCDEFSNILTEFCKSQKIPCVRVDGYVKYLNFMPGDKFSECNHAWNAVYVDSTWMLCDLFWATNVLVTSATSNPHFVKTLNTKYYLAEPETFIVNHLPSDPVFQFDNYPIRIGAFTAYSDSIDLSIKRMPYLNYKDSLKLLLKLSSRERTLRIAQNAYAYNKDNPNFLIAEYYNYSVSIVNNKSSTVAELQKAKTYLSTALVLIDKSDKPEIIALKSSCKQGLSSINRRLSTP